MIFPGVVTGVVPIHASKNTEQNNVPLVMTARITSPELEIPECTYWDTK